jgi:hypothetical protein
VLLSDGSSKTPQKTFYQKNRVEKFYKKIDKKSKTDFSRFFYLVFGRFSVRGVKKHDKKISQKKLTSPGTVLASEELTNHVGIRSGSVWTGVAACAQAKAQVRCFRTPLAEKRTKT